MKLCPTNIFALFTCCVLQQSFAVTIVYNMRIAEVSKNQQISPRAEQSNVLGETLFGQWEEQKDGAKQSAYGTLATYIRSTQSFYLKIDGAVGRVKNSVLAQTFKRTQTDDLLFTGGYNRSVGAHGQLTCSGLFGIPTHRDTVLDIAQFGTGHFGLGGQLDFSYVYTADKKNVLHLATRLIHFFPRHISSHNPCLKASYAFTTYNFRYGNTADLFFAHRTNWAKVNHFDIGYDASFIGFGSHVTPNIPNFENTLVYIHNTFFGVYSRFLPSKKVSMSIILGLAGGFDSRPEIFGNRYLITTWLSLNMLF